MTKLKAHRMFALIGGTASNVVLAGMWIPAKSTITRVRGYVVYESQTILTPQTVFMGSLEGYILPVTDPDSVGDMDALWNAQVPKDSTAEVLDLDAGSADSSPFWEPGAQRWEHVFDVGAQPTRVHASHFLCGIGHNSIVANRDPDTPFAYEFLGGKMVTVNLRGGFYVDRPSLLVFASGSPATTATSITQAKEAIQENEWGQLQFIDHVMERAMLDLLGIKETGAETPWEEATNLLKKHLDPLVLEPLAGTFEAVAWMTYGEFDFDVSVQGTMPSRSVDLGR